MTLRQRGVDEAPKSGGTPKSGGSKIQGASPRSQPRTRFQMQPRGPSRSPSSRKIPNPSNEFRIKRNESPRQVSFGFLLLGFLIIGAFAHFPVVDSMLMPERPGFAFRKGAIALFGFLTIYCLLNTRDGVLVRPHPTLWRFLHGWNLWYCLLVTTMLVVPVDDGRVLMQWLFPLLERKEEPAVTAQIETEIGNSSLGYDHLDCEINQKNVMKQLTSIWFTAHCLGWFAKMLMLRDFRVCIVYSSVFELTELTLQFMVPEFQECWWDSIILDWLVSNTLIGMASGWVTLQLLNVGPLVWTPGGDPPMGMRRRVGGVWRAFMPSTLSKYEWNPGNDPVTMLLCSLIWILMAVGEVNSFFLISILQLPRSHIFNPARQALLCFCAAPAVEEWYEYTRHSRKHYLGSTKASQAAWDEYLAQYKGRDPRIGHFTWLLAITVCLETAAIVKYSDHKLWKARPGPEIWGPWAGFICIFTVYFLMRCYFFYGRQRTNQFGSGSGVAMLPNWLRYLRWVSCVPLLWLMRLYAF